MKTFTQFLEQKINERAKTGFTQLDIATNIDAAKLLH
jgi:hypothetical protein